MAQLQDLIAYLSQGTCIAWVGAGPSIELGLPSWKELANGLLSDARRSQKANFRQIEDYYRLGKYPEMFGEVERSYGKRYLLDYCARQLKDPGSNGAVYSLLTQLPFTGYFTTNVEDSLCRHLAHSKAYHKYLNSQSDLGAVEIEVVPAVVKLHGSLADESSLILTDSQYKEWYYHGSREYYRMFVQAHMACDRILFVGYSMNDPDILHIRKTLDTNLRRKVPAFALLANAGTTDIAEWSRNYNVEVITYAARGRDHSELLELLNALRTFLAVDKLAPPTRALADVQRAQKLYLWHRFQVKGDTGATIDSMKGVVLASSVDLEPGGFGVNDIVRVVAQVVGLDPDTLSPCVGEAVTSLAAQGWFRDVGSGKYVLDDSARKTIRSYNQQFDDLIGAFKEQSVIDLRGRDPTAPPALLQQASGVVVDAVVDIFSSRGIELVQLIFANQPVSMSGATDVFEQIWSRANSFSEMRFRFVFVQYLVDLLTKPTGVSEQFLDYLAKAFFSMQALCMDPTAHELLDDFLKQQALLVDENVLIPLLSLDEPRHQVCRNSIGAAIEHGVRVFATDQSVSEVVGHARWAVSLVATHGEQSVEVFEAATGRGEFTQNAFLAGFVEGAETRGLGTDFETYVGQCLGGKPTTPQVWQALKRIGVHRFDLARTRGTDIWNAVRSFIDSESTRRWENKSPDRMDREADAYTVIAKWIPEEVGNQGSGPSRCSFLTFGTALAYVARRGPFPLERSILVSPQALYELLVRYINDRSRQTNFRTLMLSSYFRPSGQFIDKDKYTHFFGPLLREYGKTFDEHLELYRRFIDKDLSKNVWHEWDPLDKPLMVASLEQRLVRDPERHQAETAKVVEENLELKRRVQELEDRERRRREYVKKQQMQKRPRKR